MSRGLGKTQKLILGIVKKRQDYKLGIPVTELVVRVYHPERFDPDTGDCYDWTYTQSEYIATHTAVRSLEKRGLVKTKSRMTDRFVERDKNGNWRGGASHMKVIITPASEKRDAEIEEEKKRLMSEYGP